MPRERENLMVTKEMMRKCLGKIKLMAYCPAGEPEVWSLLAQELNELCADDSVASELIAKLLDYERWPGVGELRRLAQAQQRARKIAAMLQQARAERDRHEQECPGYTIICNEAEHVVEVRTCNRSFNEPSLDWEWVICGRSEGINISELERAELAKRPGWISREEHVKRLIAEERRKRWI